MFGLMASGASKATKAGRLANRGSKEALECS